MRFVILDDTHTQLRMEIMIIKKNKSLIREINWVHWDHNFCIAIKTNVMRVGAMIVRQFDIMLDEMYHQIGQSFYMSHFAE